MTASMRAPTSLDSADSTHFRCGSGSGYGSGGLSISALRVGVPLALAASRGRDGAGAGASGESDAECGFGVDEDDAASDVSGVSGLSGAAHSALLRNMHEPEPADEQLDAELSAALDASTLLLPTEQQSSSLREQLYSLASPSADTCA